VKLLENTFRSVNIGLVNEMAIVCEKLGVDVWEVIEAAATKPFGFMKFLPGPGLGGHCIPIDPHYLSWKMRGLNYKTRFIDLAGEVNTEMPLFWVRKVVAALNDIGRAVRGSSVLVIGVAYKRDIDDLRESPALDIIKLLEAQGAKVQYHDPYVSAFTEDGHRHTSVPLTAEAVAAADCVMIVTDHTGLDYGLVKQHARSVVDT
ncbi:MAG: nucleotide sugar dehydrogenase, partial [Gemmatimonadales bacterium]|nr:nucleotide sugar dehydrogenase [Gemmatimonadales bacterium]